jgi:hypothetical protein
MPKHREWHIVEDSNQIWNIVYFFEQKSEIKESKQLKIFIDYPLFICA